MKKQTSFMYKAGLAFVLLSVNTLAFAQQAPERQHVQSPGRPSGVRSPGMQAQRMNTQPRQVQRPSQPNVQRPSQPNVQRPINPSVNRTPGNRPSFNPGQRPSYGNRPNNPQHAVTPRPQSPQVNRNPVNRPQVQDRRFNSGRPGFDNRVIANNRARGSYGNRYAIGGNRRVYNHPRYTRPPVVYNGHRFYSYHNYNYHPYRPYYYGSFFHPFGFFTGALSAAAFSIAWNNQNYWYDQGVYYAPYNNGYQVIPAPAGAFITALPNGYTTVNVGDETYFYFAGSFYATGANGYEIVQAPPGAVVYDLPEGAKEVTIADVTYLLYNDAYFQPITLDGKDAYEVVDMEDDGQ